MTPEDSLMAAGSFLIHALKLLLLANATLKHKTPRSEDWMAYATQGMVLWLELLNFVQKTRFFSYTGIKVPSWQFFNSGKMKKLPSRSLLES